MQLCIDPVGNGVWALCRAVGAWWRTRARHGGDPRALGRYVRAWWRLRDGRRHIVRLEHALQLPARREP